MKIVFICGSLESRADGVGDYTRRLATELIRQGNKVAALALNDQFTTTIIKSIEIVENVELQIYRVPSNLNSTYRFKLAQEYINDFNPDWLSLQYVPFSFNSKGLPFGLSKMLSKFKDRKWHIMFHELWVGMEEKSTLKHVIWGEIQKVLIKKLIKTLKPSLIHTQTKLYQIQLSKLGFNAEYLPLFSNIPININLKTSQTSDNKNKITFVNFGTIHPTVPIESFAKEASLYVKNKKIQIDLILIGRCGNEQERWKNVWESNKLKITVLGEQTIDNIADIFNTSTFGISTTAIPLIEKSGSVAAMQEYNLPVICISNSWNPRGIDNLPVRAGVIEYCTGNFESCIAKGENMLIKPVSVVKVSQQLVDSFKLVN